MSSSFPCLWAMDLSFYGSIFQKKLSKLGISPLPQNQRYGCSSRMSGASWVNSSLNSNVFPETQLYQFLQDNETL